MPRVKGAISAKRKQEILELENLKLINESLKGKLDKYKASLEKLVLQNETLTIENQRLQIKANQEEHHSDIESSKLLDKARKDKVDNEILNEFIKKCKDYSKEINELKQETTSLRTRLKEKFDLLTQSESNSERVRELFETQNMRLKSLVSKYEIQETNQNTDYVRGLENILEKFRERTINLRRELLAQKSDFNISLNRFRRKELFYVDELKRLKTLNEKLNLEIEEKSLKEEKKRVHF